MKTTTKTPTPVKIWNKLESCTCGCRGKDSWHASTITRIVRNVRWHDGSRTHHRYTVVLEGEAKFPWGVETVYKMSIRLSDGTWTCSGPWVRERYTDMFVENKS